ncbi:hypothetical protein JCM10207_006524 [Rhodosporidiobolus poonsookiae]
MTTDQLRATASIWSRLPNEEKLPSSRGRISPSSRSSDSHSSSVAPKYSAPPPHSHSLAPGAPPYLVNPALDFAPSPRSSISSASFSPTPDSSNSPRDRLGSSAVLHPPPTHPSQQGKPLPHSRFSPQLGSSLSLYPDPPSPGGAYPSYHHPPQNGAAHTSAHPVASGVTAPAPPALLSPPLPSQQSAPTSSPSTGSAQPLLAEIFSGNPRPHYRPPPVPELHTPSPRSDASAHLSPPPQPEARSYFAARPTTHSAHGRARSQSSAPSFEKPDAAPPASMQGYSSGHRASIAAPGAPVTQADQHGFRPSSSLSGGGGHFSASLPTTSAVGSPALHSFRELQPSPSRGLPASSYSPFGPSSGLPASISTSSISGAADPQTGWRSSTSGAGLSHSFSAGWDDEHGSFGGNNGEREGRARFRDAWAASGAPAVALSSSASSTGTGGIGMSNMSPFTRDGSRTLADAPVPGLGAADGGMWGSLGGGGAGAAGAAAAYRARREYSLGAVGTGRKRSDSAWGRGERLKDMDEDGEDDGVFAPPTRSGATSRRHSFAAFEPPSRSATTTLGFHLPEDGRHGGGGGGFGPLLNPSAPSANNGYGSGLGSSAINDDDLAADLNSLHLNLEAHVAAGEPSRFAHVGSMPADFPPARSSRTLDQSRAPPPPRSHAPSASLAPPIPSSSSTATATPTAYHAASSPRATAEPFTPSMSSSSASRFFPSPAAPAPLPPTTTTATATASNGPPSASRFDFGGPFAQPPAQARYGGYGTGLPPPVPPPSTQHAYYSPAASGPLSPRGGLPPPHLPPQHSGFPSFGAPSPSIPPPHAPPHLHQLQTGYFAPPPPPSGGAVPPSPALALGGAPALTAQSQNDMNLGRGVPLHAIPSDAPLCIVGFKAGRKDLFFCEDPNLHLQEGDLVIVEADRGRDVGKYLKACSVDDVHKFQQHLVELALGQLANPSAAPGPQGGGMPGAQGGGGPGAAPAGPAQLARMTKECQPKRIYGKAGPADTHALLAKAQDEVKALALVRSKVAQKGLPMEILDAEWQWDRRKLTFYYTADQRVDFRELVRELFRIWKTRVWLCCLDQQQPSFDFA